MTQPGDVVITQITGKQIYDEVRAVHTKLDDVSTKFDGVKTTSDDHERRLRALERRMWGAMGGGTVLGAIAGAVVTIISGG